MTPKHAERLESLRQPKLSKARTKEIVNILTEHIATPNSEKEFVEYIMRFHPSIAEQVFQEKYASFWLDKLPNIISAFTSNEKFKTNSADASWARVCVIVKSFVQDKQDCTVIMKLFDRSLAIVTDITSVKESSLIFFQKTILKSVGTEFFLYASCPTGKSAVKTMDSFIVNLLDAGMVTDDDPNITSWYHNHGCELKWKKPQPTIAEPAVTEAIPMETAPAPTECISTPPLAEQQQLCDTLAQAQRMATNLNELLSHNYGALAQLTQAMHQKEQEIAYFTTQLQEKNQQLANLQQQRRVQESAQLTQATCTQNELQQLQAALAQSKAVNEDLNARLAMSLQMDGIAQNQELLTLKTNIKKSLQLEYDDYLASEHAPFNEDEFIANRATIARIFRGLKRLGISFESEDLS